MTHSSDEPVGDPAPSPATTAAPRLPREKSPPRFTFGRNQKLKGKETIDTVYKTGRRRSHHPLAVHAVRRADNGPSRLGISIGRACGNAVKRNLIKRRLREAYRLMQHEVPPGYDYLVVVRPHAALALAAYQAKLQHLLQ